MSQDNGTPADTLATNGADSLFSSAIDLDQIGAPDASGESGAPEHDPDFEFIDSSGKPAGGAEDAPDDTVETGAKPAGEGEPEKPAGEGESDGDDKPADDKPGKKASGSARLKAKVAELEARVAELTAGQPDIKSDDSDGIRAEVRKRIGEPPKQDDFENFLDFEHAKAAYVTDERLEGRKVKTELETAGRAREALHKGRLEAIAEAHAERLDEVEKAVPGALQKIEDAAKAGKLPVTPELQEAILDSDKSGLLHLHFAENPEKLAELVKMPVARALRDVGRIEAGLSLPKPKTETKAPPVPPKAPRGTAPARNADADLSAALKRMYG